jgi:chromosome segregation ATPase
MRMKRITIWSLLPLLLFSLLLMGSGRVKAEANYRVITATDLHYLAPELTDHGEYFWRVMENADGKVSEYCEEITEAFLEEVVAERPEALILTGDLSFNGARASHEALAKKLAALEAELAAATKKAADAASEAERLRAQQQSSASEVQELKKQQRTLKGELDATNQKFTSASAEAKRLAAKLAESGEATRKREQEVSENAERQVTRLQAELERSEILLAVLGRTCA